VAPIRIIVIDLRDSSRRVMLLLPTHFLSLFSFLNIFGCCWKKEKTIDRHILPVYFSVDFRLAADHHQQQTNHSTAIRPRLFPYFP
jgi:hypothetical protein